MIDIGDFAPDFVLPDEKGRKVFSRAPHFAGRFVLMLSLPRADDPAQQAIPRDCAAGAAETDAAGISMLAVTGQSPAENNIFAAGQQGALQAAVGRRRQGAGGLRGRMRH